MDHIEHELFELVSVRLLRLDIISVIVDIRYLLLHYVKRHAVIGNIRKLGRVEQIVQDHAVVISGIAVLVLSVHHFLGQLIVFNDRGSAVLKAHDADLFIGSSLAHDLCADSDVREDRRADEAGIADALENIVHRKNVDPLDAFVGQDLIQSGADHRRIPSGVAVGRGGYPFLCLPYRAFR